MTAATLLVRRLGRVEYAPTFAAMVRFTAARTAATPDELWLLEHPPVYTLGLKARGRGGAPIRGIPVVATDRGGDITYHGPGQLVAYLLLDLARRGLGPKELVRRIEQALIELLAAHGVAAARRAGAPGVYVGARKIAALGLRLRAGRSYHGLALNRAMDLAPFGWIDPCGYAGLEATQLRDLGVTVSHAALETELLGHLARQLGYTAAAAAEPLETATRD
jgi:lipoyl(octanoyl) transferase